MHYRRILYFTTFISFICIVLFLLFFGIFAPGNYQLDCTEQSIPTSLWNGIFAFLLLVNTICVVFSLFEVIRIMTHMIRKRQCNIRCLIDIIIGLYPFIVNYCIYRENYFKVIQYIVVQIQIIF